MSNILIVDDSAVVRRILTMNLEQQGYETIEASNGQEALDLLAQYPISFIFADLHMPVLNGMALLRIIRQSYTKEQLPVVMLTALGEEAEKIVAEAYGINEFITKPVSSHVLLSAVQRYLIPIP